MGRVSSIDNVMRDITVSAPGEWNLSHKASATRDDYFFKCQTTDQLILDFQRVREYCFVQVGVLLPTL